ncbi:MAG: carbamate kinase [Chitinivibrionales bacterium]|nr:carbamate kinase [Chitinivibrionales bacterium]
MKTIICALGGNALIKDGQKGTAEEQLENLQVPCKQIAQLSRDYRIIITHGNGPQVGNLVLQQEGRSQVPKMPLEVLVAQTQGQIGYMIEQTLDNQLMELGISEGLISTVITYVQVDRNDPAFQTPTKPIGPAYKRKRKGFVLTNKGWRKVVASPQPLKIIEWREIKTLLNNGFIVVACGGGGIPVTSNSKCFEGIEAVIDKDLASAKLGEQVDADLLIIATEVEKVALDFNKPTQRLIDRMTVDEAQRYLDEGHFPPGNMGPKIKAAINFVKGGKEKAIITSIDTIQQSILGQAGTHIVRN